MARETDIDAGEPRVALQLQRVGGQLLRRETETESSDAPLPLPEICTTALKERLCAKAGVRPISVHSTRRTCASLLIALDVHPRVEHPGRVGELVAV